MRWWCAHFGQTLMFFSRSVLYSTVSQAGHFTHSPSGTVRRSLGSVGWIFGGRSFSSQLIAAVLWLISLVPSASLRRCGSFVERRADAGDEAAGNSRCLVVLCAFEELDQRAADHDRIGYIGHCPRRGAFADAEADADRQLHERLDSRNPALSPID